MSDPIRTLTEIVEDRLNENDNRASECLRALDLLRPDDDARLEYLAASQTFAMLAIADALHTGPSRRNIAEVLAIAGDVQL